MRTTERNSRMPTHTSPSPSILRWMPWFLFLYAQFYLVKPCIRGLGTDLLGGVSFRYAFINSHSQAGVPR